MTVKAIVNELREIRSLLTSDTVRCPRSCNVTHTVTKKKPGFLNFLKLANNRPTNHRQTTDRLTTGKQRQPTGKQLTD